MNRDNINGLQKSPVSLKSCRKTDVFPKAAPKLNRNKDHFDHFRNAHALQSTLEPS
jgi:hypothetical protein